MKSIGKSPYIIISNCIIDIKVNIKNIKIIYIFFNKCH